MKILILFASLQVLACHAQDTHNHHHRDYDIEAYQQEGDTSIFLKIKPILPKQSRPRQVDEDDDDADGPSTTPYIPMIIPGLTKIFNGIVTGNLNMIFHGSTSFAPKQTSHAIDTVYNTVVGLPTPRTTVPTTRAPVVAAAANGTAAAATSSTDDDDEEDGDLDLKFIKKQAVAAPPQAPAPAPYPGLASNRTPRHAH